MEQISEKLEFINICATFSHAVSFCLENDFK